MASGGEMIERIGQQLGNYQLIKLLGHGGFADVYLGEHVYLKTQAAIKVLHTRIVDEDIETFRAEAQTIAHLLHPHIIRVLDFDVDNQLPLLVMDYAPNGTLRQRHPKGSQLPPVVFLPYVKQIASALQYAHERKLVHRDVKPENMLIGYRNDILLSDFGIALIAQTSQSQSTDETVIGTMSYMAPEQIQGKARPASDQYALAVVVYEWLCGAKPFNGSYVEVISQHLSAPPPLLHERIAIPPAAEQVILRALAKDPRQRFPSMQEFAEALERAYQYQAPQSVRPITQPMDRTPVYTPVLPYDPTPRSGNVYSQMPGGLNQSAPIPPTLPVSRPIGAGRGSPNTTGRGDWLSGATASKVKKHTGTVVRRGLSIFMVAVIIAVLLLCALGFGVIYYIRGFGAQNSGSGTAAAVAVADDFLTRIVNKQYDQAYNDFGPSLTAQVTRGSFAQLARDSDRCEGPITQYTKDTNTTIQHNSETYNYTMTRARLTNTYQLTLTLQKDASGKWHITDYNSTLSPPKC
ncbi:MAG: serine/threonine protein kinase [Chloroflexota bacterium]|nr:serine/threonine protein kinase [Chloroflexota bacterium]